VKEEQEREERKQKAFKEKVKTEQEIRGK